MFSPMKTVVEHIMLVLRAANLTTYSEHGFPCRKIIIFLTWAWDPELMERCITSQRIMSVLWQVLHVYHLPPTLSELDLELIPNLMKKKTRADLVYKSMKLSMFHKCDRNYRIQFRSL